MIDAGGSRLEGARVAPFVTPELEGFFEGARQGELRLQRCGECGRFRHPPKPACPACHSMRSSWERVSGRGRVWSYTVVHHSANPKLADRLPYDVVLVEPDEAPGVHVLGNMVGCELERLVVGLAVEVAFEAVGEDLLLPVFRPVAG